MADSIPKAVETRCADLDRQYALVVWLDGRDALVEFTEHRHSDFHVRLDKWRRNGRDGLDPRRCNVRFYVRDADGTISLIK